MNKIFWVGPRQSDIDDINHFFQGSVTIFGDNTNGNISYCSTGNRINHNIDNPECDLFFESTLRMLCQNDPNVRFMFYNPVKAYQYDDVIRQHTLCVNDYELISALSSKKRSRILLKDIVKTVPFVILIGVECTYRNLCSLFVGYNEFVLQKTISSGGEGTFHISAATNLDFIQPHEEYVVSPYINNAVSLNAHVIISQTEIISFQPSVQIIQEIDRRLLYYGADYICYNMLPENTKQDLEIIVEQIGKFVQRRGYRGVLGIDFILKDKQIYFIEFNTRFQASSQLLNKALWASQRISLQELNINAFTDDPIKVVKPCEVNYSNYTYSNSNISISRLKRIIKSPEVLLIQKDGYTPEDPCPNQSDVYLNRVVFGRNICSFQNNRVILHPNIYCEDIKPLLCNNAPHYHEHTKIALLNHGVVLSDAALQLAHERGKIKEAVFDAIDAIIFESVYVNMPNSCKFSSFSPFCIDVENDKFVLEFDGEIISEIYIDFVPDVLINKTTHLGVPFDAILNLATDRIRINPAPVCHFKQNGAPCKFCNLPYHNVSYDMNEIKEAIVFCLNNVKFRHFLIGGGTYSTDSSSWEIIAEIAQFIRERCDKDIYLMSIPPENNMILDKLKNCGITEVAFNLEIFDREMAVECMPGKGLISFDQYMSALSYAVSLWGNTGNVRSLLIYGFDTDELFLNGIESLCAIGVEPIISVFRPLEGTDFSELNPPPTLEIVAMYEECQNIAAKYSLMLGPDCPMCQNNTLSFSRITHSIT